MNRIWTSVGAVVLLALLATESRGQAVLKRIEERVRKLAGEEEAGAPPASIVRRPAEPGYLGVIADDRQEKGRGVRVMELVAGAPGERDGLLVGDVIVAIDEQPVRTMDDMTGVLEPLPANTKVKFRVSRAGAERTIDVTLAQRPVPRERGLPEFGRIGPAAGVTAASATAVAQRPRLGVRAQPISEALRQQMKLPEAGGALVVSVEQGSPAEQAGIKPGAAITAVDGQAVSSPDELGKLIGQAAGNQIELTYYFRGREVRKKVTLVGAAPAAGEGPALKPTEPGRPAAAQPSEDPLDESRLEGIERRLQQLEDRIEKLEKALEKPAK